MVVHVCKDYIRIDLHRLDYLNFKAVLRPIEREDDDGD